MLENVCGAAFNYFVFTSRSPEETFLFGEKLGRGLRPGDTVALSGELGAGKTCLAQGIARGLGVPPEYEITSPTFNLINEYPGRLTLYHMDMYRLSSAGELDDIGFNDCCNGRGVVVIEWAEKISEALPENALFISLKYSGDNERKLEVSCKSGSIAETFM